MTLRKASTQTHDDWDARLVKNLRAAGGNSFTPYEVDFFFNLPTESACASLRSALEPEGFAIDARAATGEAASGYSAACEQARARLGHGDAGILASVSALWRRSSAATTTAG